MLGWPLLGWPLLGWPVLGWPVLGWPVLGSGTRSPVCSVGQSARWASSLDEPGRSLTNDRSYDAMLPNQWGGAKCRHQ
jgi:hypothetical protein